MSGSNDEHEKAHLLEFTKEDSLDDPLNASSNANGSAADDGASLFNGLHTEATTSAPEPHRTPSQSFPQIDGNGPISEPPSSSAAASTLPHSTTIGIANDPGNYEYKLGKPQQEEVPSDPLFAGLQTVQPPSFPTQFYPGSSLNNPPPQHIQVPMPDTVPQYGQPQVPSYASLLPPGYPTSHQADQGVVQGVPASGVGSYPVGMAPPAAMPLGGGASGMGAVFNIPELPEAAMFWHQQSTFMTSWHITQVTNIIMSILFIALADVWGIIGGILGTIASGLYVCKCGGEVISGSLKTIRVVGYVAAGFNAFQAFIFALLVLTSAENLESGGVLFVLLLIAWYAFCAHQCIEGGRKAMHALQMSGLLNVPPRYLWGINMTF